MPARCPTCGEEALTETARFCVGCGEALPELDPFDVLTEMVDDLPPAPPLSTAVRPDEPAPEPVAPPPPRPAPAPQAPPPRADTPTFEPRPAPSRSAPLQSTPPPPSAPQAPTPRPPRLPTQQVPMRDLSPIVPLPLVVAGVVGLLALL